MRRAEVREVLHRLAGLPWVDQHNLFLAGHSEGGTTAMYSGDEFNAYFIAGGTCTSNCRQFDRIHAPSDRPVLAVVGAKDPYHVGTHNDRHCGNRMAGRLGSRSIVVAGVGHDVTVDPTVIPTLIKVFKGSIVDRGS